jgi:hypothetical protein
MTVYPLFRSLISPFSLVGFASSGAKTAQAETHAPSNLPRILNAVSGAP